ncbi:MAG TPA: hypothetical protein VH877_06960 [Polyangia bacterium]|jgi:hypothetical protein|nr:hypothetical protein [Polyangia bacterium]
MVASVAARHIGMPQTCVKPVERQMADIVQPAGQRAESSLE